MVELLKKNPAVAVPVVLARLKQKDEEWCAAAFAAVLSPVGPHSCQPPSMPSPGHCSFAKVLSRESYGMFEDA